MLRKTCRLLIVLSIVFGLGLPALAAADGPAATVRLSVDRTGAAVGADVKVTVAASALSDVYAYEAVLRYDAKRLKFKSAVSGADGFTIDPIVKDGEITLAHTKVGKQKGDSGAATLAVVTFTALAAGEAQVALVETKLVDSKLDAQTLTAANSGTDDADGSGATVTVAIAPGLRDITGHWAEAAIRQAVALGIAFGTGDGLFEPDRPVTRAEFAVMLARAMKPQPGTAGAPVFRDAARVPAWAQDAVAAAAGAGWVAGYGDGTFRPEQPISRAELAALGVRALGWKPAAGESQPAFADADAIASWARPYAALAAERKLMAGRGGGLFVPDGKTTRAEAVVILIRMYDMKSSGGG